ncbi:MAG: hypothetical protein CBC29_07085 [Methylococcaceae bacterium TMED69]|nr:MAG: hypothetical protein CBC29_07085 [Methylococcaceae bacterium TMED69]|tara:strand:+ start:309 stop:683 length:375 start_codon:yes stop_codon:yes gene_type:complete
MKLTQIMEGYFREGRSPITESRPKSIGSLPAELPIKAKQKEEWKNVKNPSRMVRIFKIEDEDRFNNFIIDVLEMQSEMAHHGRISIQYPKVKMEIWTHTLMEVTELDKEWCKKVDNIHEGYKDG